uniref:Uncharacterized protein n=1 Tax=Rhizophora mucronata TaxID=61149 RepID=A0A2P2JC87_RHIMU
MMNFWHRFWTWILSGRERLLVRSRQGRLGGELSQGSGYGLKLMLPPFVWGMDGCALLHKLQPRLIDLQHFFAPSF